MEMFCRDKNGGAADLELLDKQTNEREITKIYMETAVSIEIVSAVNSRGRCSVVYSYSLIVVG